MNRRTFFKTAALAAGCAVVPKRSAATVRRQWVDAWLERWRSPEGTRFYQARNVVANYGIWGIAPIEGRCFRSVVKIRRK